MSALACELGPPPGDCPQGAGGGNVAPLPGARAKPVALTASQLAQIERGVEDVAIMVCSLIIWSPPPPESERRSFGLGLHIRVGLKANLGVPHDRGSQCAQLALEGG